jgi:hypothetical protein
MYQLIDRLFLINSFYVDNIPLNSVKSYKNGPFPVAAKYWLIVPPINKIKTIVVAIQIGP